MTTPRQHLLTLRTGDLLIAAQGQRYVIATGVTDDRDEGGYLILRPADSRADVGVLRYLSLSELDTDPWTHRPREEVIFMENQAPDKRGRRTASPHHPHG